LEKKKKKKKMAEKNKVITADLDEVTFLGDKIPIEVLRILPILINDMVSLKSLQKTLNIVLKFLTNPSIESSLLEENILDEARKYTDRSRELIIKKLEEILFKELDKKLKTIEEEEKNKVITAQKKIQKNDKIHLEMAKEMGIFNVLFTGRFIK
jgi:hypothetical protein